MPAQIGTPPPSSPPSWLRGRLGRGAGSVAASSGARHGRPRAAVSLNVGAGSLVPFGPSQRTISPLS